ncbi:hypothetical protein [Curtobacterium sp. MCSS17_007]|uniref:hypothetical protein n=1 Tax=Curtobacterium sp. MCSS17_007 TaxID=2175646 RepID=UPI000DA8145E|nr:hypothetical protein [Curtobacterium sp. MCSS17_007]WIE75784.1 hypothetical protein DEJ22_000535 [Curtobacterium sp. MCSS17_007]
MEWDDDDTAEEAPPGWVLSTPTRYREIWGLPALALVLAAVAVAVGAAFGDALASATGAVTGALGIASAVLHFVSARRAYLEQTWGASWDLHRVRVAVGVTAGAAVMVASIVVGLPLAASIGVIAGFSQINRYARSIPRFDLSAVAWAFLAVVASCAVLVVLGLVLPTGPVLPGWRATVWVVGGTAGALFAAVLSLVHVRRAARAPRY